MAFLDFVKSGFDTDYLFLDAGAWETNKEVATQQEKLTQEQYKRGAVGYDEFQARMQEISGTTTYDALFSEPGNSPTGAFVSELGAGVKRIPDNVNRVLGGTISGVLRSIPFNLWVILFLALAVWLSFQLNLIGRFRFAGK